MDFRKEISEKENMELVLAGKTPAWLPSFYDACAFITHRTLGRHPDPASGCIVDAFGVKFIETIDGPIPINTTTQNFELKDITKWRDIMPQIDLDLIDWEEEANAIRATVKEGQMMNFNAGFVWEQLHYMMGFEEALIALVEEPEAASEAMNAIADFQIDALRRLYKYLKPELVMFMEHVATASGLMMSPDTYRSVIKPVHKKMFDAIIDLGAVPEMHVDGLVEEIIPDYAELGIKVIQPFQVFNDINRFKEEYGLVAIGGWNAIGPGNQFDSTEEDVRASVRLAMDTYGPGGRYVFFESGCTPRFPNIQKWITDEARTYGAGFYR